MRLFTKRVTSLLPNFGSGRISRLAASRRRGIAFSSRGACGASTKPPAPVGATWRRSLYGSLRLLGRGGCCAGLGALQAVLAAALATVGHASRVERAAHDVVTHAGKILHTAAADQHDAVFLEVVPFAGDVSGDFNAVGQTHTGHFAQGRVRLFGRHSVNARANAAFKRRALQSRGAALEADTVATVAYQLADGRSHVFSFSAAESP